MTVRQWFRLNRAAQWMQDWPEVRIYFRNEHPTHAVESGPLRAGRRITSLIDLRKLIDEGLPDQLMNMSWDFEYYRRPTRSDVLKGLLE